MLEKIICIDNVGIFKKGAPSVLQLERLTLIYADNARGKSTLSSLLLACATANSQEIISRRTVGALSAQKAVLRFSAAEGAFNVEFDGVAWKGNRPNLHVFNQTFVERNVYASTGVLPEQREALLTLALGDAAVAEREKFEQYATIQTACSVKLSAAEAALIGFRGSYTVDQFLALKPVADVSLQLAAIDREIGEARAAEQITNRPEFRTVTIPTFKLDGLAEVIESSYESLAAKAEEMAKEHFAKHNGQNTERWVAIGLEHKPDNECPFCGQNTLGLELLKAYKAYFDRSYSTHLKRVTDLRSELQTRLTDALPTSWTSNPEFNDGLLSVWAESLQINATPILEFNKAISALRAIKIGLLSLFELKEKNPLAPIDAAPLSAASVELEKIVEIGVRYNVAIEKLNHAIQAYKAKCVKPELNLLTTKREQLVVVMNRFSPKVELLVKEVTAARIALKEAEKAKTTARTVVDQLMAATLKKFEGDINGWLTKFAAPFEVGKLSPTYKGGGLRSEYVLKVRGATVNVGPGGGGELSFHAALSEGDKRTLAFAFFLAQLFSAPRKENAIVVLDDVFTSLDRHRRHNTIDATLKMVAECAQVISLGHDAHFLRELKKRSKKKKMGTTIELALSRDADDYSYLAEFDLDDYCSSEYYKHYVKVEQFLNADPLADLLEVAKSLRLLVEGHLHRCFPRRFKEEQTVGEMLDVIKNAKAPNPLTKLQPLHADLLSFNEFAAAFHHDTSGGFPRTEVNSAELLPFAKGALSFIQIRSFSGA